MCRHSHTHSSHTHSHAHSTRPTTHPVARSTRNTRPGLRNTVLTRATRSEYNRVSDAGHEVLPSSGCDHYWPSSHLEQQRRRIWPVAASDLVTKSSPATKLPLKRTETLRVCQGTRLKQSFLCWLLCNHCHCCLATFNLVRVLRLTQWPTQYACSVGAVSCQLPASQKYAKTRKHYL